MAATTVRWQGRGVGWGQGRRRARHPIVIVPIRACTDTRAAGEYPSTPSSPAQGHTHAGHMVTHAAPTSCPLLPLSPSAPAWVQARAHVYVQVPAHEGMQACTCAPTCAAGALRTPPAASGHERHLNARQTVAQDLRAARLEGHKATCVFACACPRARNQARP